MIPIRHRQTGEIQIVAALDGIDAAAWEELAIAPPAPTELAAAPVSLVNGAWVQASPRLTPDEIFNLFTGAEKTAILTSGIAQVTGLVLALRFQDRVALDSTFHSQGVALLAGLGFLTAERAAQVLAGSPPPPPEEP